MVHVVAGFQVIDHARDGDLVVVAIGYLVPAQGAALAGAVDHEHRDAAPDRAGGGHEPHLVLERVQPAEADQHRLPFDPVGGAHEVGVHAGVLVGDLDFFHPRAHMASPFPGTVLQLVEDGEPARIVAGEPEFGLAVIIHRPEPAVLGGLDVAVRRGPIAAPVVAPGDAQPFPVPALLVSGRHAARRLETLADRAAALLGLAQRAAELVRHPRVLGPVVPAIGLEMRALFRSDSVDELLFQGAFSPRPVSTPPRRRSVCGGGYARHVPCQRASGRLGPPRPPHFRRRVPLPHARPRTRMDRASRVG